MSQREEDLPTLSVNPNSIEHSGTLLLMGLNVSIASVFCLIDDRLKGRHIRWRSPTPVLSNAQVLTIEVVGEFFGIDTDEAIYLFFRRRYPEWFLHKQTS